MNSGSNHPASPGGRGRKRRRGRRNGQGAAQSNVQTSQPGTQPQDGPGNPSPASHAKPAKRPRTSGNPNAKRQFKPKPAGRKGPADFNGSGSAPNNNKRVMRGVMNHKTPDASVYSAPMDHSYRSLRQDTGASRSGYEAVPAGQNSTRPIFIFIDDLFFMAKVQETARKLNVKITFAKTEKEVLDALAETEEKQTLIIIDLNHHTVKPLAVISKLKTKFKKEVNIIGFLSHIQGELKVKAQEAGCDMVLPRSAFSQNLPQLLRRHATNEAELQEY